MSAVLLLSGGKDSAWVALFLAREYRWLRVTALTVDTGFMSPVALANARRVAAALDLEHVILSPDLKPMLRDAFLQCGSGISTVDMAEGSEVFHLGAEFAAGRGATLASGLTSAQMQYIGHGGAAWSPLSVREISEERVQRDIAHLGLVTSPLRTNSRLMVPLLVLDVRRTGRSSFRPYLTAWYWRFVMPALEWLAHVGAFNGRANRVLAELDLTLDELCPSR